MTARRDREYILKFRNLCDTNKQELKRVYSDRDMLLFKLNEFLQSRKDYCEAWVRLTPEEYTVFRIHRNQFKEALPKIIQRINELKK